MKEVTTTRVKEKFWGPDDTYLAVEVQVFRSNFKDGQKVKVTIESLEDPELISGGTNI